MTLGEYSRHLTSAAQSLDVCSYLQGMGIGVLTVLSIYCGALFSPRWDALPQQPGFTRRYEQVDVDPSLRYHVR